MSLIRGLLENPILTITNICAVLLALSMHEAAHAFAAYKCGDPTAKQMGRLTLNPLKHLDPMGTISMILLHFGWAKPVPINPANFRNRSQGIILTSVAGVATNFLLAFLSSVMMGVIFGLFPGMTSNMVGTFIYYFLFMLIQINVYFALFNLLPIPPLDGYQIFKELTMKFIPLKFFWEYEKIGRYILWAIVLVAIFSSFIPVLVYVSPLDWLAILASKIVQFLFNIANAIGAIF